jgi:sulfopyruvate decarboxylase TPP-binding subunit
MIEAKEFWEVLCEELDYRFFTGVPCLGLKPIYNKMDPRIMHYVPATKENAAIGLASGVSLSGVRSGILIDIDRFHNVLDWLISFNLEYTVPLLIIAYNEDNSKFKKVLSSYKIPHIISNDLADLKFIVNKLEKLSIPGVFIIGKGVVDK